MRIILRPVNKAAEAFITGEVPQPAADALGMFLEQQVKDRFRTQGASSGTPWKKKRNDDGRATLTGRTGNLLRSFHHKSGMQDGKMTVSVYSDELYAFVHQNGTIGAGGTLPDIKPVKAKALFIPLTDRAASSQRVEGAPAATFRRRMGMGAGGPIRIASKGRKVLSKIPEERANKTKVFASLKQGRIHKGQLQVKDAKGEWIPGRPDFIFLKVVKIPPRPMLPDSPTEKDAQAQFVGDMFDADHIPS